MLIPRRLEPVITLRGILNGVLSFSGDVAGTGSKPIDHDSRIIKMLRLRHFEIGVLHSDVFANFGSVYLYEWRRAGALTDQFAGEIEVGNASSLNAEIFHNIL
jgi:hypothetical protein